MVLRCWRAEVLTLFIGWGGGILRKRSITLWGSCLRWGLWSLGKKRQLSSENKSCFGGSESSGGIWELRILELVHKMSLWQVSGWLHLCKLSTPLGRAKRCPGGVPLRGVKETASPMRCCVGLWSVVLVGAAVADKVKSGEWWSATHKCPKQGVSTRLYLQDEVRKINHLNPSCVTDTLTGFMEARFFQVSQTPKLD